MNQNVFGVILFSFIVGTAMFVSAFFAPVTEQPLVVVEKPTVSSKPTSCFTKKKFVDETTPVGVANIKVVQAVLNQNTSQLDTDFFIERGNFRTNAIGIALHFFSKDGGKTRYLATQTVTVTPDFDYDNKANQAVTSSYQWLDDLKRRDNLYVIAELSSSFNNNRNPEPRFDETKATAVLLDKGK